MRALVAIALLLLVPVVAAEQRVEVLGGAFTPASVVVEDWERVVWSWPADETHGLVADDSGEAWCEPSTAGCARVFQTAGVYRYHCSVHPEMTGSVTAERRSADPGGPARALFVVRERGLTVELDASDAAQARVAIESYRWDFGDGETGTGRLLEHTYSSPGTYVVRLTVVDEFGDEAHATRSVTLLPEGDPLALFRVNASGRSVLFEADPREGEHTWELGDVPDARAITIPASPTSLVHVYARGGAFLVNHTFVEPEGARHTALRLVRVDAEESFHVETEGLTLVADAGALPHYANANYTWLFGDLAQAQGPRVSHTFPSPGRWSVELRLTDAAGEQTLAREVPLEEPPRQVDVAPGTQPRDESARARETPLGVAMLLLAALLTAAFFAPERYK